MSEFKNNIKYRQIVKSGKDLFWKFGIKKVSVEEICEKADVSKATYYKFFKNKVELAELIFKNIINEALKDYEQLIISDKSFEEKIRTMFQMKLAGTQDISKEFINDVYKNPKFGMIEYIEKQKQKSFQLTLNFIEDSQKKGCIDKKISSDFIIYFLNKMPEMVYDEQLLAKYQKPQDLIMELLHFFFYGIGVKNNK